MAATPLITFKAGRCDINVRKVKPIPTPGYIYLYSEDDLIHLCWRPRSAPATDPEIDLITIPGDATFSPLVKEPGAEDVRSPTNGRIFCLSFSSSGEKQYFWMQAKSQHGEGDANWFSQRDQRLGQIVDLLLSGEDVDVEHEVEEIRRESREGDDDGDESDAGANEDTDMMDLDRQETGGAGADATGGDPREEGEQSREGGADGGRAASSGTQDTSALVQDFLNSISGRSVPSQQQLKPDKPFTTLSDLLSVQNTIPFINSASTEQLDHLCSFLPPELFLLAQEGITSTSAAEPSAAAMQAAIEALSPDQKREIMTRVLHSPQLQQSLGSLTVALRDGGLPMVSEALRLKVRNGGNITGGSVPMGGGEAVEAFVEGVRRTIQEEEEASQRPSGQ